MVEEIVVDRNLLYLRNILEDLDGYEFDNDIELLLNKLKDKIDFKLYHNSNNNDLDITDYELIERFYYEKQ